MRPTADRYERALSTETVMIDVDAVRERAKQIRNRVGEATEVLQHAIAEARRHRGEDGGAFGLANHVSGFAGALSGFVGALGQECEEISKTLDSVASDAQAADLRA